MKNLTLPLKYTTALFAAANEMGQTEKVRLDLESMQEAISGNLILQKVIFHPGIKKNIKRDIVTKEFGQAVNRLSLHFLCLLIDKKREGLFGQITSLFSEKTDEQLGIHTLRIETAYELSAPETQKIRLQLEKKFNKKIKLDASVDEGLLGGIVIKDKMTVLDGSVRQFIDSLRQDLKKTKAAAKKNNTGKKKTK
jgi:F-type H+-transporting ATPase subunit delta